MSRGFATLATAALTVWLGVSQAQSQTADQLFASQSLQRLDLWVNTADWNKLGAEFQTNPYLVTETTMSFVVFSAPSEAWQRIV